MDSEHRAAAREAAVWLRQARTELSATPAQLSGAMQAVVNACDCMLRVPERESIKTMLERITAMVEGLLKEVRAISSHRD
jgi:hypothetical protein